ALMRTNLVMARKRRAITRFILPLRVAILRAHLKIISVYLDAYITIVPKRTRYIWYNIKTIAFFDNTSISSGKDIVMTQQLAGPGLDEVRSLFARAEAEGEAWRDKLYVQIGHAATLLGMKESTIRYIEE